MTYDDALADRMAIEADLLGASVTKLRTALRQLASFSATCERENSVEWMVELAGRINHACDVLGDPARFVLNTRLDRLEKAE